MYLDIIKKCATRNLFDVHLMKNANIKPLQIGICKIAIDKNTAILNNLEIHNPYKRNGYGSFFLQEIEKSIQTSHNIKEIGLTAWQSDKNNVSDFFKKMVIIIQIQIVTIMMTRLPNMIYIICIKLLNNIKHSIIIYM